MGAGSGSGGAVAFFQANCTVEGRARRATRRPRRAAPLAPIRPVSRPGLRSTGDHGGGEDPQQRPALLDQVGGVVDRLLPLQHLGSRDAEQEAERPGGQGHGGQGGPDETGAPQRAHGFRDPDDAQSERGHEPQHGPGRRAAAPSSGRQAEALARDADEVERSEGHRDRLPALARGPAPPWRRRRRRPPARRRGDACGRGRPAGPGQRCAPRNTLKNGTAAASTAAMADQPFPRRRPPATSATSAPRAIASAGTIGLARASETSRLPRRRSAHQWACGLKAKAKEKSVARSVHPARATPSGRQARARAAAARTARRRASAKTRHVEARHRVVGIDRGPAQGGRAHEVGPEVVAEREAGHARAPAAGSRSSARGRGRRGRRCRRGRGDRAGTRPKATRGSRDTAWRPAGPRWPGRDRGRREAAVPGAHSPSRRTSRKASARRTAAGKSQGRPVTSEIQYAAAAKAKPRGRTRAGSTATPANRCRATPGPDERDQQEGQVARGRC